MAENENSSGIPISDLIIEVTRRCNMCCPHCLRGDAQDMDITREIIDKVIRAQEGPVDCVTFTGGEPTLNLEAIRYYFQESERQGKLPRSFYVATNGKEKQEELANLLLKWYPKMERKGGCGVALSIDEFHDSLKDTDGSVLRDLEFYDNSKELPDLAKKVSNEGRAYDNGIGIRDCYHIIIPYGLEKGEPFRIERLYVSANGKLFGDCGSSFERMDRDSVLTIDDLLE